LCAPFVAVGVVALVAVCVGCGEPPAEPDPKPPDAVADTVAPVAVLSGPSEIGYAEDFELDGSGSSDTSPGEIETYRWRALTAAGGGLQLDQSFDTKDARFVVRASEDAVVLGAQRYRLVVVDKAGNVSAAAEITVLVVDDDTPTAVLTAPSTVEQGAPFTLDGSGSSDAAPGALASWRWSAPSAAAGFVDGALSRTTTTPTLIVGEAADLVLPGSYRYGLVVTDQAGNESPRVEVDVVVRDTIAPVASLSAPSDVDESVNFTLDGASSTDAAPGTVTQWRWTALDASGGGLTLTEPLSTNTATLVVDASTDPVPPGAQRYELVVFDSAGNASAPVTATVVVNVVLNVIVDVAPTSDTIEAGAARVFLASVTGTQDESVEWLVDGIVGGDASVGWISDGRYEAPSDLVADLDVTITARSVVDPGRQATASVLVRAPPATWGSVLSLPSWDRGDARSMVAAADGGVFIAGSTRADAGAARWQHGDGDAFVLKVADNGRVLWAVSVGSGVEDLGSALVAEPDGGVTLFGTTRSFTGSDDRALFAMRLDAAGEIVAQRSVLDDRGSFDVTSASRAADGGYLVALGRRGLIALLPDLTTRYAWGMNTHVGHVVASSDGGAVFSGPSVGDSYAHVVKLDSNDELEWDRHLWKQQDMLLTRTGDDAYIVGHSGSGGSYVFVSAFDLDGALLWSKRFTGWGSTEGFVNTYNNHISALTEVEAGLAFIMSTSGNPYVAHVEGTVLARVDPVGTPTSIQQLSWGYSSGLGLVPADAGGLFALSRYSYDGPSLWRHDATGINACERFKTIEDPLAPAGVEAWVSDSPVTLADDTSHFSEEPGTLASKPTHLVSRAECPTDQGRPCRNYWPSSLDSAGDASFTVRVTQADTYLEVSLSNELGTPSIALLDAADDTITLALDPPAGLTPAAASPLHWYFESPLQAYVDYPLVVSAATDGGEYGLEVTGWQACPVVAEVTP
jgi:hypothetical protein